jgi:sugar phosphate isomerase/epimerase
MNIGFSVSVKQGDLSVLDQCVAAGIRIFEIYYNPEELFENEPEAVRAHADALGATLASYHFPFIPFEDWDISVPETAERVLPVLEKLIDRWSAVGIQKYIVHPSGEPIEDAERAERLCHAKASLARLAAYAEARGCTVCVEDLPRTNLGNTAEEMEELIQAHPALRVCFDTNHLQGQDPAYFVRHLGKKIVTTHISDCDSINERHWLPGEGELDFPSIYRAFLEIGYEGAWLYELGLGQSITAIRPRDLRPEDIVKNAEEIFSGKKPTPFGYPKPGIGMWE